ncbi:MAG: hypothetical protein Kow0069_03340 [Promethearchaeota archaeon]
MAYLFLLIFGTVVLSVTPLLTARIIDEGIIARDGGALLRYSLLYMSLMAAMGVGNYVAMAGMGVLGQSIVYSVRDDVFTRLQEMSMNFFDRNPSGDVLSRATNDVDQLNLLVSGQLVQLISSFASIGLGVTFMFLLNPFLAAIGMVTFPAFILLLRWFQRKVIGAFKETRKKISNVTSRIQENVAGAKVVQAYGQQERALDEFDRANEENYQASFKARRIFATFFPTTRLLSSLITVGVLLVGGLVVLGRVVVANVTVTVGTLAAFIQFLAEFFRPIMMISQIQQVVESAMAASDRVYSLLQAEVELPDPEEPVSLEDVAGAITFEDVSFGYRFDDGDGGDPHESGARAVDVVEAGASKRPGFDPAEMMRRVAAFLSSIPPPHGPFLQGNLQKVPVEVRRELMASLMGVDPAEAPPIIDEVLARHGVAVPGSGMARRRPELRVGFGEEAVREEGGPEFPAAAMTSNPAMLRAMVSRLKKALEGSAGAPSAGGGGMDGEVGGPSGGMRGPSTRQLLRVLASVRLPPELEEELPAVVREAVEEERVIMERESSVGYVLRHVDHQLDAGKTLAIVGKTGAGKTTWVKLVCRFYDVNEGRILVDGVDVRDVKKNELRSLLGLVPQDSFLFTGTIRENLLYGCKDGVDGDDQRVWEEKMVSVAKFLGLHNFVETLPDGYDTRLTENASNLSIGQRQLMAFARALIQDPKILILDEATSSVDPYTETLIQDALDRASAGRTTIIIAHRLSTIKNADWIVVLDAEKKGIVEQGTHEQLVALNGAYKRLLDMQRGA